MFQSDTDAEAKSKRAVGWWKVSLGLIVLFTATGLVVKARERLASWYEVRALFQSNPALGKTPSALSDRTMAQLTGFRVELFGLAVQTPWNNVGTIQMLSDVATIPFPEQHVEMTLFHPSSEDFGKRMFAAAHEHTGATVNSNYGWLAAEMFTTPDDVKWWKNPEQNEARTFLLEMKSMQLGNLSDIYSVEFGGLRGFQEGNPALPPYQARLDLFDSADRHYQIRIAPTDHNGPVISQAQINAMATSIQQIAPQ
jgi:hypothetical protein